jgi:hypothetical protein
MGIPSRKLVALRVQSPSLEQVEHPADALMGRAAVIILKTIPTGINADIFMYSPHDYDARMY